MNDYLNSGNVNGLQFLRNVRMQFLCGSNQLTDGTYITEG